MTITNDLLRDTAIHIADSIPETVSGTSHLHNYSATVKMVQTCDLISVQTELGKQDRMKILLSAWFLYAGYANNPENYQNLSAELAVKYYTEKGLDPDSIEEIKESILSTCYPQQPVTVGAQVLCDAEKSWFADKSFFNMLKQYKKEKKSRINNEISNEEWLKENIAILENHIYFTPFSRKMFEKKKEKNKALLEGKLAALQISESEIQEPDLPAKNEESIQQSLAGEVKLERGVESLFRNTSRNQIHLIRLSDYKANLIISINSIIISVILSVLVIRLDANKYLELPTLLLILTSVITILIAVSATRPKINIDSQDKEHFKAAKDNLLYFGNFYKMPFKEYNQVIKETIVDREELYNRLSMDIYHQGIMLAKKFKQINLSYSVFIIGLTLSILVFIVSFLLHQPAPQSS